MKFGSVPLTEAEGAILAHSVGLSDGRLRKGARLDAAALARLRDAGRTEVIAARLEPGDLDEDAAARMLAAALVPDPEAAGLRVTAPFTGRVNLIADGPGVVLLDADALGRFNRVHPMITVATVPPFQQMSAGGMVATIKIISYAVPEADVVRAAAAAPAAVRLAPPIYQSATLIVTEAPGGADARKGMAAVAARLEALGMTLAGHVHVPHERTALAGALAQIEAPMALILTASATSDPEDVAPSAVRQAGGAVERFGMPVDPGNLLFLGRIGSRPVIGLPGCARSPALNGADWVLSRVACGLDVTGDDIAGMGVGGLLKEIPTRPQPRAGRRLRDPLPE